MRQDGLTVWTSSQSTHSLRGRFASILNLPPENVRFIYLDGSGSYGGNGNDDVAADAAVLSKAVGKPVRVQWMRQDEHGWDPKGPQQLLEVRAGLDAQAQIAAWETQTWLPMNKQGGRPFLAFDAAGISQPHGQAAGAVTFNADPAYEVPNLRVTAHWMKETPLRPSNIRAPGKIANVFAVESFTDELAMAIGDDPLEFRLRGLKDPRAIEVLQRSADMLGWTSRLGPPGGEIKTDVHVGKGIAYARYKQQEVYVAMAMEVAVNIQTGIVTVRRITCAHDCGLVINPDATRNQIEGNILQSLSRCLHEEVKFDRSRVTSVDWSSYPILTFPEMPKVEVAIINRPTEPPWGVGEAASVPVAAALGNAVFDATAARIRTVPFTPERVKAALASS
jgi:CO/xanthine dehydrogenase Mo-binding subunit